MSSIPSSAMPHAYTEPAAEPAPPPPSPLTRLIKLAAVPALVTLGMGAMAVSALTGAIKGRGKDAVPGSTPVRAD